MPFEFGRMMTALVRDGFPFDEAYDKAFADFERRHDQAREQAEEAQKAQEQAIADQQQAQAKQQETQRQHEKDLAEIKKPPARPAASANRVASPLERMQIGGLAGHHLPPLTLVFNAVNKAKREISGYASVWNSPMRDHKIMAAGSFPQSTIDLYMTNPVLLFNHDDSQPVGTVLELKSDEKGLLCRAVVNDDDTWQKIEDGRVRAFSWMGIAKDYRWVPDLAAEGSDSFHADHPGMDAACCEEIPLAMQIEEAELWEISIVTLPNSPQCLFEIAKSYSPDKNNFSLWAPIRNIEASERMVYGYALVWGEPDGDGHVVLREDIEPAVEAYRQWANIREQHSTNAVGTAPVIRCDDFGLWIGAQISTGAEECWNKIRDRTYKGFSIGGWADHWEAGELDGEPVVFLRAITIEEISVCDRPKVAKAVFSLVKRQGGDSDHDDSPAVAQASVSSLQGESMSDKSTETLAEKRVGALSRIADAIMEFGKKPEDAVQNAAPTATLNLKIDAPVAPMPPALTDVSVLSVKTATGEPFDLVEQVVQNAAMTKATQAQIAELSTQIQEALKGITALASPPAAATETEQNKVGDEDEAEENAAKKKPLPPFMKPAEKAKNGVPTEILDLYGKAVQNGLSRIDAFQAVADHLADDETALDQFIGALGFPEGAVASTSEPTVAEQIACAVKAAMEPLVAELRQSQSAARPARPARQRMSAPAHEISGAFGDEAPAEGFWTGAMSPPVRSGRRD